VHAAGPGAIDIERLTGWSAGHAAPAPGPAGIGPGARQPAARRSHRDNYEPAALGDLLGDQVAQAASLARVR